MKIPQDVAIAGATATTAGLLTSTYSAYKILNKASKPSLPSLVAWGALAGLSVGIAYCSFSALQNSSPTSTLKGYPLDVLNEAKSLVSKLTPNTLSTSQQKLIDTANNLNTKIKKFLNPPDKTA